MSFIRPMIAGAFLVMALILTSYVANAHPLGCGPYEQMKRGLAEKYGEAPIYRGMNGQIVMEFWANPETGTWTMNTINANGLACMWSNGEGGEMIPFVAPDASKPTNGEVS